MKNNSYLTDFKEIILTILQEKSEDILNFDPQRVLMGFEEKFDLFQGETNTDIKQYRCQCSFHVNVCACCRQHV